MNENLYPIESVIQFSQSRLGKKPARAYTTDAGIDFFVPTFTSTFIKDLISKNEFLLERDGYSGATTVIQDNNLYLTTSSGTANRNCGCRGTQIDTIEKQIPENLNIVKFDAKAGLSYFELHAHQRVLIPSGIYCKMQSDNRALIAANKSGVATKNGLIFGAQVVDSSYQGEIHISVINTSSVGVRIYEDMKIIQFVETPIYTSSLEFVDEVTDLYKAIKSERGVGGFGSSDKKMLSE